MQIDASLTPGAMPLWTMLAGVSLTVWAGCMGLIVAARWIKKI